MGALASRRSAGVEEVDIASNNAYKYPPKSGNYFASHFIMGGERFETTQPEAYLFGENQDLNFLGNRPVPFPYPAPQANEPTRTLKSLVNIRKDSMRFVRIHEEEEEEEDDDVAEEAEEVSEASTPPSTKASEQGEVEPKVEEVVPPKKAYKYNLEFTFDTDVRCAITIMYFATEEISNGQIIYHPKDPSMNSETYHYKRGANQVFSQSTHLFVPSKYSEEELTFKPDKDVIPIVVQCVVEDEDHIGHSHMTFCTVEASSDGGHVLKPHKQKQMVDGLCYLLQEIYGIENKNMERSKSIDDDLEDNGSECVICMCDIRDTLILPCRHLCLCNNCADSLRYQASNCPICRAPFRALLQIRAMRKKLPTVGQPQQPVQPPQPPEAEEYAVSQEGVPSGYEAIPLIEALNGPGNPAPLPNPLQMSQDGLPQPLRCSAPTSPMDSPMLDKRKNKSRQPSLGASSIREATVQEEVEEVRGAKAAKEAEEGGEEREDECSTPEVVMTGQKPDPVKTKAETPRKASLPKTRHPGSKIAALSPKSPPKEAELELNSSVEIINEISPDSSPVPSDGSSPVTVVTIGTDLDDLPTEDLPQTEGRQQSPGGAPYKPEEPLSAVGEVEFKLPAHAGLLYDKDSAEEGEEAEEDPLVVSLPSQVMETISLPGTPVSTTDGSSYSSTSSTRMLINGVPKDDDPNKSLSV